MTSLIWDAGTATVEAGSAIVTGTATGWLTGGVTGGLFVRDGSIHAVVSVEGETTMTIKPPWSGTNGTGSYFIQRSSSDAANVVDLYDRLAKALISLSLAGIHPHGVGTLAKRDSLVLDDQDEFIFLRAELGEPFEYYVWDGPTDESWLGPYPVAIKGDAGTGAPGQGLNPSGAWLIGSTYAKADLVSHDGRTFASIGDGNIGNEPPAADEDDAYWMWIPAADGQGYVWRGGYSGGMPYAKNDIVLDQGSSWVALQSTTGNAPPTLPTSSNAYWELMAAKGADGAGTGDMSKSVYDPTNINSSPFARANHTGTQLASTISDFSTAADSRITSGTGSTIQAYSAALAAIADLAVTDSNIIVGNGTTWVAESGATARTSLGLGTANSPQFTAVNIGHASDTTLTRVSAGVAAIEGDNILTASLIGVSVQGYDAATTKNGATQTLSNKRITTRVGATASSSTPTPDGDANDVYAVTALAAAATIGAPTGTPTDGQKLIVRIRDNGTARALTWNAAYRGIVSALPATTVVSKTLYLGFIYNSADSKWDLVAVSQEA